MFPSLVGIDVWKPVLVDGDLSRLKNALFFLP